METQKCKIALHKSGPSAYGHWEQVEAVFQGISESPCSRIDYPGEVCGRVVAENNAYVIPMDEIYFN